MYVSSTAIRLLEEISSFVCFFMLILLSTKYAIQPFFAKEKPKKAESKAAQEQYIETKLQEHLSNLEARVNQGLEEIDNKMLHKYNTKHIEDLHEKLEALEATCKKDLQAFHLILDNKSLLFELAIQSRETRMDGNEKIQPLDHSRLDQNRQMRSLSAAVRGIADATNTLNDLLPRVVALEISRLVPQETAPKFTKLEKQIEDLSQKLDQIDESVRASVERSRGDQLALKTLVKFNRTALETKMNVMEADFRGELTTHDHQITNTIKAITDGSVFVNDEFGRIHELAQNASAYCANLKESSDLLGAQIQYLFTRLTQLEQWLQQTAGSDSEDAQPDQIILY